MGFAVVHWTMTIQDRMTGWLDHAFHSEFRFLLVHSLARFNIGCAAYCMMPDHVHLLMVGMSASSDQKACVRHFRLHTGRLLRSHRVAWQKQAFDHVLRENERDQNAFAEIAGYILQNPVRAGLVEHHQAWPFSGGLIPGYPDLEIESGEYWSRFWRVVHAERQRNK